jgi:hypothetical protein
MFLCTKFKMDGALLREMGRSLRWKAQQPCQDGGAKRQHIQKDALLEPKTMAFAKMVPTKMAESRAKR